MDFTCFLFELPVSLSSPLPTFFTSQLFPPSNTQATLDQAHFYFNGVFAALLFTLLAIVTGRWVEFRQRRDRSPRVDYDVVVDIQKLRTIDFSIYARDRATLQAFEGGFQGRTVVAWGPYNVGKTFVLGRIFGVVFCSESLTERTKALSYKRFGRGAGGDKECYVVVDCAGNSTPASASDDLVLLDKFATEKFLHEFAYLSSDVVLLVFDCCSWDNLQKIVTHRRRAFNKQRDQKEIYVILNWKVANTREVLRRQYEHEVLTPFRDSGSPQSDLEGHLDHFIVSRDEKKGYAGVKIYWLGDDRAPESRAHNTRVTQSIRRRIGIVMPSREIRPLQGLYEATGISAAGHPEDEASSVQTSPPPPPPPPPYQASETVEQPGHASLGSAVSPSPASSAARRSLARAPLLFDYYNVAPKVELRVAQRTTEVPRQQRLVLAKQIVSEGEQSLKGELKFDLHHLRFTDFDLAPEIHSSRSLTLNQPLVKCYKFSLPGLKLAQEAKPAEGERAALPEPNTFTLTRLRQGYEFELRASWGALFDQQDMASENSTCLGENNTSKIRFNFSDEHYGFVLADNLRGVVFVWTVKRDETGENLPKAEEELKSLRFKLLRHYNINLDSIPEETVNEFN